MSRGFHIMPTKIRYQLAVAFSLMSVLPLLVGLYVASLFIRWPFESNDLTLVSIIMGVSGFLAFLGYQITKQMVTPIAAVAATARKLADGRSVEVPAMKGNDEIEELSKSLRTISLNARELLDRVEKLSLKDKLTGLHNASYIRERLNEEIERAIHFQRPCSFAYLSILNFDAHRNALGEAVAEKTLKDIADILRRHTAEFDRAARISNDEFAVILPDKNKKKAISILEAIRTDLAKAETFRSEPAEERLSLSIGLSENPLDGVSGQELFIKARDRAAEARRKGGDLIEAFA